MVFMITNGVTVRLRQVYRIPQRENFSRNTLPNSAGNNLGHGLGRLKTGHSGQYLDLREEVTGKRRMSRTVLRSFITCTLH